MTPFLPIWIPFITFCCLIAKAKTSNTVLNSGRCVCPCHVPDLAGKLLSFFPNEEDIRCVSFVYGLSDLEVCSIYPYFLKGFYQERMLYFVNCAFSASIGRIMWFLSFLLLMWCITLIDLWILNQPCIPGINPTWSWWIILLMFCWIRFAVSCWEFLHPCLLGKLVYSPPF